MYRLLALSLLVTTLYGCGNKQQVTDTPTRVKRKTFANPVDLSYRFRPETPSRREAADPTVVFFKDRYYLFASKSGGYWHSFDLVDWTFIETNEIPTERYAPTVIALRDTLFLAGSSKVDKDIYKTADPLSGQWIVEDSLDIPVEDPAFFQDTDGKLYLYWGCHQVNPIYGAEIDPYTFSFIGETHSFMSEHNHKYGWEVRGDYNQDYERKPWLEGAWINKYKGKYYFQYSAPGTVEKSYADGVYVADTPLGDYKLQQHNPFAYKPEGYSNGAGHGSTLTDKHGNYWHFGTGVVNVKHIFERRINFFPVFFDDDGLIYAMTKYGDYPMVMPNRKIEKFEDIFPGWMLLSYNKPVEVSSQLDSFNVSNMTDENIRTYWAAKSAGDNEWATIDLMQTYDVYALQINFAEHMTEIYGRQKGLKHQFIVEVSSNKKDWKVVMDKSKNNDDRTHNYFELPEKENCRYVRVKNISSPGKHLAMSGFRVFGKGKGKKPASINDFQAIRDEDDRRRVHLNWDKVANATGYNISFGIAKDKLYHNYLVYDKNEISINSLNAEEDYYFTIEAFNENGITPIDSTFSHQ